MGITEVNSSNKAVMTGKRIAAENATGHLAEARILVDEDGVPVQIGGGVDPADVVNIHLLDAGSEVMNVDGSTTPVVFKYTVPTGKIFRAWRLMLYLDDATAFTSENFGDVAGPLANGVTVHINGTLLETWVSNHEMALTFFNFIGYENLGKSTLSGAGRWSFADSFGGPLNITAGQEFKITINDDLRGLVTFHTKIQGMLFDA